MPVKKRVAKRRLDPAAELAAWSLMFASGYDYFDDLPAIGVVTDAYGKPDRTVAQEAWRRLGARFLAEPQDAHLVPCWALKEFGEPHAR